MTGFGVVLLGVCDDGPRRVKHPERCAGLDHPGATFNPWANRTWCLCGEVQRQGNHFTHAACCDGPLETVR